MLAGRKNQLVALERPVITPDGQGGREVTWQQVGPRMWAEIRTSATGEVLVSQQVHARVTRTVRVWYAAAIADADPTWRIVWGRRILHIQAIEDVEERHHEMIFHCHEVQGQAA